MGVSHFLLEEFFRKEVAIQQKNKPSGSEIINGLQTNGTLIDSSWCDFFAKERFNIGISIDGPDEVHNRYRRTKADSSVLEMVMRGHELLVKHGIVPEILCVVNSDNVKHPLEIYRFFKTLGAKFISFLPLVELMNTSSMVSKRSVPALNLVVF